MTYHYSEARQEHLQSSSPPNQETTHPGNPESLVTARTRSSYLRSD